MSHLKQQGPLTLSLTAENHLQFMVLDIERYTTSIGAYIGEKKLHRCITNYSNNQGMQPS